MRNARALLDNCVPYRFNREVRAAAVTHVLDLGWEKLLDRPLLEQADGTFDVVITVDRNIPDQQNLTRYQLALIILRSPSNRLTDLLSLAAELNRRIEDVRHGELVRIFAPDFFPRDYAP